MAVGVAMLMASCELETSDNGKLDGLWQLCRIDTLTTGTSADMREKMSSWAFQGRLMQVRCGETMREAYLSFERRADSLILSKPYLSDREADDIKVEHAEELYRYGLQRLEEGYKVIELSSKRMRLKSELVCIDFRKY